MKVYVITKGEYSDYHICAVSVDKDEAEKLEKIWSDEYEPAYIEEFDTKENAKVLSYKNLYNCHYKNGQISIYRIAYSEHLIQDFTVGKTAKDFNSLHVIVSAEDEELAFKIASDKFAKYRAEQLGL